MFTKTNQRKLLGRKLHEKYKVFAYWYLRNIRYYIQLLQTVHVHRLSYRHRWRGVKVVYNTERIGRTGDAIRQDPALPEWYNV